MKNFFKAFNTGFLNFFSKKRNLIFQSLHSAVMYRFCPFSYGKFLAILQSRPRFRFYLSLYGKFSSFRLHSAVVYRFGLSLYGKFSSFRFNSAVIYRFCLSVIVSVFAFYSMTAYSTKDSAEANEERVVELLKDADTLLVEASEILNELNSNESDEESNDEGNESLGDREQLGEAKGNLRKAKEKFEEARQLVEYDKLKDLDDDVLRTRKGVTDIERYIQETERRIASDNEEETEMDPTGLGPCDPNAADVQAAECCRIGLGLDCENRIRRAVEDSKEVCSELKEKAFNCCYTPASCLPGGEITGQIANVAGMVNSASGGSMSETCKKLKQSLGGFSSINAFMAVQCRTKARKCSSKCSESLDDIDDAFRSACGVSIDPNRSWRNSLKCDQDVYEEYQHAVEKLEDIPGKCREVSRESNRQTAQLASQLMGLFTTAKACKLKLTDEGPVAPTPCTMGCPACTECIEGVCQPKRCGSCEVCMPRNGECVNICIEEQTCNDQGRCVFDETTGETDGGGPNVQDPGPVLGNTTGLGGGGNPDDEDGLNREPSNEFGPGGGGPFAPDDFDITDGGPPLQPGQAGQVGSLLGGTGGGGGGGGLGGGSGGGGGGGGYGGGGGEGDAAPNNILQGFKSGKFGGYGGAGAAGKGKSGHRGYGRGAKGRGKRDKKGKKRKQAKLDLKDLIPKDKKLDQARGKFGSVHDNIFQRVSNRVQVLCRKDKMTCR